MSSTQTLLLYVSSTGSVVSPAYLLQDSIIQGNICHQLLQPGVLLLEFLETLCLLDSHPTIFLAPAIVGLLGDSNLPAGRADSGTLAQKNFYLPELVDDLHKQFSLPCAGLLTLQW